MAHSPALRADPSAPTPAPPSQAGASLENEPDQAVATSAIAAQGPESSELALDLILHDIAERARQSTGASGAAIALERAGTMVCRAAAGATAPDLGMSINTESGLTGACVREQRAQWCPDSEADDRVDAEACRQLDVRSIAVVPLFANDSVMGVFEIFSGQPRAFGERELKALQDLALWVTEAVKSGASKPTQRTEAPTRAITSASPARADSALVALLSETATATRNDDRGTKVLRAVVLALAVLLFVLLGYRWGWQRAYLAKEVNPPAAANTGVDAAGEPGTEVSEISTSRSKPSPAQGRQSQTLDLQIYQPGNNADKNRNGKKENASDREVLVTKLNSRGGHSDDAKDSSAIEKARQEAPQNQTRAEAVPLPSSESLAGLSHAPVLPPLTADLRPATPAPMSLPVSHGVTAGRLIRRVNPTYPSTALKQRISGPVVLEARIGKDGHVYDLKVVSGHPFLATAAVDAVRQWQYDPYKLNGQAVDLQTQITVNFNLP
jgi:TonB family protein